MALKAGRVGVSPTEVDKNGHITGGGSSVTVVDNLTSTSSTDALSAKQGKVLKDLADTKEDASKIGGFEFRNNEGTAQYRTSSTGEWVNFNSAGGNNIIDVGDTDGFACILALSRYWVNGDKLKIYSDSAKTNLIGEYEYTDSGMSSRYVVIANMKKETQYWARKNNSDASFGNATFMSTGGGGAFQKYVSNDTYIGFCAVS